MVSEILLRQDFKGQGHYDNVKGQITIHCDTAHLNPPTNVPTKYELPLPHSFSDIARTIFPTTHPAGCHG